MADLWARSAIVAPRRVWIARLIAVGLGLMVGLAALVCLVAYLAAARWTHPVRSPIERTPAALALAYEEVTLTTEDNLRLDAWYSPSTNGATIILLHGLGGNRSHELAVFQGFARHGYGVLAPDLRAHGTSEGAVSTLGLLEVRDVRAAVRYLHDRGDVDTQRIGIYGASLGGAVAILAGAEIPDLKAVAAEATFASIDWVVSNQFSRLEVVPQFLAPLVVAMGSLQARVDAHDVAPVRQIERISPRPVMIVHGEIDQTFVPENARLLYEAAREPKELWIDKNSGHGRRSASDPLYAARLLSFFDRSLLPVSGSIENMETVGSVAAVGSSEVQ